MLVGIEGWYYLVKQENIICFTGREVSDPQNWKVIALLSAYISPFLKLSHFNWWEQFPGLNAEVV